MKPTPFSFLCSFRYALCATQRAFLWLSSRRRTEATLFLLCLLTLFVGCKKDDPKPDPIPTAFTVTFNANGGTGTMAAQIFTTGVAQPLTANNFINGSLFFAGWATSATGNLVYSNQQTITPTANLTLYAKWVVSQIQTFTVNGCTFEMIKVDGGTFTMGATSEQGSDTYYDEFPTHSVTLSGYYMGKFEVTQKLWKAVMSNNNPSYFVGDNLPVEQVSWNDIQTFLTNLNNLTGKTFKLPTEAQWEFAARGGSAGSPTKYAGSNTIGNVAWYWDNSNSQTHNVGTKAANELGIYDMSGNVWEWCSDWYGSYSSSAQNNPTGPTSGSYRVLRGGGWYSSAQRCRVSNRSIINPNFSYDNSGFRLSMVQ